MLRIFRLSAIRSRKPVSARYSDDPLAHEPPTPSKPPRNLGEPLDADDPGTWPMSEARPRTIGFELNANDPEGWEPEQGPHAPVEIGEILEAGRPQNR